MIHISIIIPIYNTEVKKIERCINSLKKQQEFYRELIIIDDGSNERIGAFIELLCKNTPKSRVIHTDNRGVSAARNLGVQEANGNYVMFVDADDVVVDNTLREAINVCEESDADIVYGMVQYIRSVDVPSPSKTSKNKWILLSEMDREELMVHLIALGGKKFISQKMYVSRGPVARIVRRELASLIPFRENMSLGEDEIWNIELVQKTTRIAVVHSLWYYYIFNNESTTKKFRCNCINEQLHRINALDEILRNDNKLETAIFEKKLECVGEMITQYYAYMLHRYGSIKVNNSFFEVLEGKIYLSCSWDVFLKLRLKNKIKYLLFRYGLFPVDIYKKIMDLKFGKA